MPNQDLQKISEQLKKSLDEITQNPDPGQLQQKVTAIKAQVDQLVQQAEQSQQSQSGQGQGTQQDQRRPR